MFLDIYQVPPSSVNKPLISKEQRFAVKLEVAIVQSTSQPREAWINRSIFDLPSRLPVCDIGIALCENGHRSFSKTGVVTETR